MDKNLDTIQELLKNIDLKQIEKKNIQIKNKKSVFTKLLEDKKHELKELKEELNLLKKKLLNMPQRRNKIIKKRSFFFALLEMVILLSLSIMKFPINDFKNLVAILTYLNLFTQGAIGIKEFLKKVYLPKKYHEKRNNEISFQIKKLEKEQLQIENELDLIIEEEKKIEKKQEYIYLLNKLQYLIFMIKEEKIKTNNKNTKEKTLINEEQTQIKKLTKKKGLSGN